MKLGKHTFRIQATHLIIMGLLFLIFVAPAFPKRLGLIVGTDYKNNKAQIPPLNLCEKDAKLMVSQLKKYGKFDDVEVLLGAMVTASRLEASMKKLAKAAGPDDTVVLYFSGHGTFQRDSKSPNGLKNYIVMFDRPHVSDNQLNEWLKGVKTQKTVWIFDACFSGGIARKGKKTRGSGNVPVREGQAGKVIENGQDDFFFQGKAIVGSSDSNETSIEVGAPIDHGIFTYYFSKGLNPQNGDLNNDKTVTLLEAFEWSSRRVTAHARKFKHKQHPQISGSASGILIAGNIKPKPPKPQPQPTPQPTPSQPDPEPSPVQPGPTPSQPADPVTEDEPEVVDHGQTSDIVIYTTIFESLRAGQTTMDPQKMIRLNRRGNAKRRVKVLVSGKEVSSKLTWLSKKALKNENGEDIPLGTYTYRGKVYKNKVAKIVIEKVPTGVHELVIEADDYPVIKRRLGVEKEGDNELFVVTSLAGYGTIRGKVFYQSFETPMAKQAVWMPTVKAPNQIHKMKTTSDGSFWFLNLPPGKDYFLKASFLETTPLDNKLLTVKSGDITRVDVVLKNKIKF